MSSGPLSESYDSNRWRPEVLNAIKPFVTKIAEDDYHAIIPFDAGPDLGGGPDIVALSLPQAIGTVGYMTSELIGRPQPNNTIGNYEIMICLPTAVEPQLAAELLGPLSYYSLETALEPGQTSDLGEILPQSSTLSGLLFCEYARFRVLGRHCGILLSVGLTKSELQICNTQSGVSKVLNVLRESGVYPVTDLWRPPLL